MIKKAKKYLNNEKGEITAVGMILIGCLVLGFLVYVSQYVFDWGFGGIKDTTKYIDDERERWMQ